MSPQSTEVGGVGGVVNRDGSVSTMRTGKSNKTQVRGGGGGGEMCRDSRPFYGGGNNATESTHSNSETSRQ